VLYSSLLSQLRTARVNAGLSQAALAKRLGIAASTVGNYEQETREMPLDVAEAWAQACNAVLHVRVSGSDEDVGPLSEEERSIIRAFRLGNDPRRRATLLSLSRTIWRIDQSVFDLVLAPLAERAGDTSASTPLAPGEADRPPGRRTSNL
jgi:transcriptional regulator with XRE-family HTH domain